MRFSTSAVCATPSAAVGSSRMMTRGSPTSERAIATVCRCPPESEATGTRTDGILAASSRSRRPRALLHADLVEGAAADELAAQPQVRDDVEVVAERQILEHGGDAEVLRIGGTVDVDDLAVELDRAGIRRVDTGQHLDECRLARAVVADERDDLALVDPEVDVGERLDGAEVLADAVHRQHASRAVPTPAIAGVCDLDMHAQ